jgi:DNA-binding transcriptional MerR regulator
MQRIFAIGAAAKAIGRSIETVRDWDRRGLLPASRDTRGSRIYSLEDIERGRALAKELGEQRLRGLRGRPEAEAA